MEQKKVILEEPFLLLQINKIKMKMKKIRKKLKQYFKTKNNFHIT